MKVHLSPDTRYKIRQWQSMMVFSLLFFLLACLFVCLLICRFSSEGAKGYQDIKFKLTPPLKRDHELSHHIKLAVSHSLDGRVIILVSS